MDNNSKFHFPPHNSSIGNSDARFLVLVAYLGPIVIGWIPEVGGILSWILPLALLLMEKQSLLVRYSAAQSFVLTVAIAIVNVILTFLAVVIGVLTFGIGALLIAGIGFIVNLIVWVFLAYAAHQGFSKWTAWSMPVIFPWALKLEQTVGNPNKGNRP